MKKLVQAAVDEAFQRSIMQGFEVLMTNEVMNMDDIKCFETFRSAVDYSIRAYRIACRVADSLEE